MTSVLTFHGTRGSMPTADPRMMHYGGKTSCVSIRTGDKLYVFDAGTGIVDLGNDLMQGEFGQGKGELELFITHDHWDHIQGIPFFAPIYKKGNIMNLYAERKQTQDGEQSIGDVLAGQMKAPYFPVEFNALPATRNFRDVHPGRRIDFADAEIEPVRLNHPGGGIGYIFRSDDANVAMLWDHEQGDAQIDERLAKLVKDVEVIIMDCAYSTEEYKTRKNWGHSTIEYGAAFAREAGSLLFIPTHYSIDHTDEMQDLEIRKGRAIFPNTHGAQEDHQINLSNLVYTRAA